jgi:Trypsin-like peptidase domain/Gram-negative bacterial TonB protein C-terminal
VRAQLKRIFSVSILAVLSLALFFFEFEAASHAAAAGAPLAALCQVVYPLDQFPASQDYHYTFYGNAFFINDEGYLLTASHVLSAFRQGGEPHIIVGAPDGPHHLLEAPLVAADWDHDVAILRATPNPFPGDRKLAYLPLSVEAPPKGESVLAASLLSADVENASSMAAPLEDLSRGEVLDYRFHQEAGAPDSEVLLVSQHVSSGQSGSPLVSADSQGVVGIIIGRWLLPVVLPSSAANAGHLALSPGAALRIHYAISLLQRNHIAWHAASEPAARGAAAPPQDLGFSPPVPVSVVGTNYPPQALFGGDVLLDALIDATGKATDIRVIAGDDPFVDPALSAVRTWSFKPAQMDGHAVEARIGIVFQFPQSFLPRHTSKERKHAEPLEGSDDQGPLPILTVEPDYPVNSIAEGSVGLYNLVDSEGHVTSTSTLLDVGSLTGPTASALRRWRFAPAKQAGIVTESAVIVVETFRRPTL